MMSDLEEIITRDRVKWAISSFEPFKSHGPDGIFTALLLIDLYLRSNMDRFLLSGSQHAYIKGKSVESTLHDATGFVETNLAGDEYTLSLRNICFWRDLSKFLSTMGI